MVLPCARCRSITLASERVRLRVRVRYRVRVRARVRVRLDNACLRERHGALVARLDHAPAAPRANLARVRVGVRARARLEDS